MEFNLLTEIPLQSLLMAALIGLLGFALGVCFMHYSFLHQATLSLKNSEHNVSSNFGYDLSQPPVSVPKHVAVIMDGNRRHGQRVHGDPLKGHWDGGKTLTDFVQVHS